MWMVHPVSQGLLVQGRALQSDSVGIDSTKGEGFACVWVWLTWGSEGGSSGLLLPSNPLNIHFLFFPYLLGAQDALQGDNQVPWGFSCSHPDRLPYFARKGPQKPIHDNFFQELHGGVDVCLEPLTSDAEQGIHLPLRFLVNVVDPALEL